MKLELAIVVSCSKESCEVRYLDGEHSQTVVYSEAIKLFHIPVEPQALVAVDIDTSRPRLVYRWFVTEIDCPINESPLHISNDLRVELNQGDQVYTANSVVVAKYVDGKPLTTTEIQRISYPLIRSMYQDLDLLFEVGAKQVVRRGYDQIADRYTRWIQTVSVEIYYRYLDDLITRCPKGSKLLDLGCGSGQPFTEHLASHFEVTGVDISQAQIIRAKQNIPNATFIQADMTQLELPPDTFDVIVALGSIIHIPRDEHKAMLRRIHQWLRPGGLVLLHLGVRDMEIGYEGDWLGTLMYWSSYDTRTNKSLIQKAGFQLILAQEETQIEDGEPNTFLWALAQKPTS